MKFWSHDFIGHGQGSPEMICRTCGYVVEKASEQKAKSYIIDREGCELHCGGSWHAFVHKPAPSQDAADAYGYLINTSPLLSRQ
jgi:hypothetical protein